MELKLNWTLISLIWCLIPTLCMGQLCNSKLKPPENFKINSLLEKNWYLIATTYNQKINKSCIKVRFQRLNNVENSLVLNVSESFKNTVKNVTFPAVFEERRLDENVDGIFEPRPEYFTVYDFFKKPKSTLLPGMGVGLYLDESLYIEYVHFDVVHHWVRKVLNTAGVSLNDIEIRENSSSCVN
ncbi:unnamed protein product [Brachionus calyciflorus]|uniref:Lipocalin/cytosolic fatty-acid binding domain-containing protein n=1 Tax=Brachionus calyciflorus TaxID=104777 RepID=A0A814DI94_9BILA|nr:unnamed protein product [Brachionus calyciflorus]